MDLFCESYHKINLRRKIVRETLRLQNGQIIMSDALVLVLTSTKRKS